MATPQTPQGFIAWMKSVESKIAFILERLNNVLANTGLSVPAPNVTQVDGTLNVVGGLTVGGPTTISGATTVSGTNGIKSSNYVAGTSGWKFDGTSLEANTGVIGNGALANPVTSDQAFSGASSFALSVAGANIITINKTVPSGFTSVVVNVFGRVAAINSTGASDHLYAAVDVNGTGGNQFGVPVGAGDFSTTGAGYSAKLTGLSGGATVAAHLYASTGTAGWAANAGNGADLAVTYIWFR